MILEQLLKINKHNINKKIHSELSPLGWHVLHCIFVEATWIRSYFYSDETIVRKFKHLADATKIKVNKRIGKKRTLKNFIENNTGIKVSKKYYSC